MPLIDKLFNGKTIISSYRVIKHSVDINVIGAPEMLYKL